MLKKPIIKRIIWEFLESRKINNCNDVIINADEIYKLLKEHPDYGDLLPDINFSDFSKIMQSKKIEAELAQNFKKFTFRL